MKGILDKVQNDEATADQTQVRIQQPYFDLIVYVVPYKNY